MRKRADAECNGKFSEDNFSRGQEWNAHFPFRRELLRTHNLAKRLLAEQRKNK